jgi:hypothetical protein
MMESERHGSLGSVMVESERHGSLGSVIVESERHSSLDSVMVESVAHFLAPCYSGPTDCLESNIIPVLTELSQFT